MKLKKLGKTGLQVSELCLGAMTFGGRTAPREAQQILAESLDLGLNFVDTADSYSQGHSEEIVGAVLRERRVRERVIVSSKFHFSTDDADVNARGNSRRHLIRACEASLGRLGTDWIDIYFIHRPDRGVPIDETLRALDDLIRSGKVRYIGTSSFAAWQVMEALWASDRLRANRVVVEQPPYNLLDRRVERELLPMAAAYDLGLVTWSPLAGGLLSGKYGAGQARPPGSRYEQVRDEHIQRRYAAGVDAVIEQLRELARARGVTLSQLAIAWVLQREGITCPIIGPKTLEQFRDNVKALDVRLTPDDVASIERICPPAGHVAPFYEVAPS